jgi:hypothetical protein
MVPSARLPNVESKPTATPGSWLSNSQFAPRFNSGALAGDRLSQAAWQAPSARSVSFSRPIAALSFDFFNTLATHRTGRGRGALVMEYFQGQGWASDPWTHAALYDVFAMHGREYVPTMSGADLRAFSAA